jgi:hypothetical protein
MSSDQRIVISTDTPECALAAFVKMLDNTCEVNVLSSNDLRKIDLTIYDSYSQVIIIGDYFPEPFIKSHHVVIVSETNLFEEVAKLFPDTLFKKLLTNALAPMIPLINNKIFSNETIESQMFFCGIYNMTSSINLYDRFIDIFVRDVTFDDLMTAGKNILTSQIGIARDRCLKNSRTGFLKNGTPFCVTNAPELMNLTHEQLHEKYPEISVTILTRFKYKDGASDSIGHSLRSWDDSVDVREIIKEHGGGIHPSVAGGTTSIETHITY